MKWAQLSKGIVACLAGLAGNSVSNCKEKETTILLRVQALGSGGRGS